MTTKPQLHPKNLHNKGYDFATLCKAHNLLTPFVVKSPRGGLTIDFSDKKAVVELNKALLIHHYGIHYWHLPEGNLCPPIPGRADYIHYLADLLKSSLNLSNVSTNKVKALDIGTGASCIYPLLGHHIYNWSFVASDIEKKSIRQAEHIVSENHIPQAAIELRFQPERKAIFEHIIAKNECYTMTLCNPPFHDSKASAQQATQRKWENLDRKPKNQSKGSQLNFGGLHNELWCEGGEVAFIRKMIQESKHYADQVLWFTSLVSKKESIRPLKLALKKSNAAAIEIIKMAQGHKVSRFIAWTYCSQDDRKRWQELLS